MRDSPSIPLIESLVGDGATVRAFDPEAMDNARQHLPEDVAYCADSYEAVAGADALVIVTEWNQFRSLDMKRIHAALKHPIVIDLRNVYDPQRMKEQGFDYFSVGRAAANLPFA